MNNNSSSIVDMMLQAADTPNSMQNDQLAPQELNPMFEQESYKEAEAKPIRRSGILSQAAKGIAEGAGTYGDIQQLVGLQKEGQPIVTEAQNKKWQRESQLPEKEFIQEAGEDEPIPTLTRSLSSKEIGKGIEDFFNIGEPESTTQKFAHNIPKSISSTLAMVPFTGGAVLANLIGSAAGETIGTGLEEAGVSEPVANTARLATNLSFGLWNARRNLAQGGVGTERQMENRVYDAMRNSVTDEDHGNTTQIANYLRRTIRDAQRGTSPDRTLVANRAQAILDRVTHNNLPYRDAFEERTTLNRALKGMYRQGVEDPTYVQGQFSRMATQLNRYLGQSERTHPDFYHYMTSGDNIHGTLAASQHLTNTINAISKSKVAKTLTAGTIGAAGTAAAKAGILSQGLFLPAIALPASQVSKLMHRIIASPDLRWYYRQVTAQALRENAAGTVNAMRKFSKAMSKDKEIQKIAMEKENEK
jgi:hypothetical protein